MSDKELSADINLLKSIISQICDYAVYYGLEPNDTIKTIAGNLQRLCEIANFNDWHRGDENNEN